METRKYYLNLLKKYKDLEQIKIVTGVRRSGKSFLLKQFQKYLHDLETDKNQIAYLNFESFEFSPYRKAEDLYQFLKEHYSQSKKVYFLFDEIQEVEDWQRLVNALRVDFNSDIYLTGSNASMLSGELATYLTGRFIKIEMMPLSFVEYLNFTKQTKKDPKYHSLLLENYIRYGGFPAVALLDDLSIKENILFEISENIILRDVAIRGGISDLEILKRIVKFLLDSIGQSISVTNIVNNLTFAKVNTSKKTVSKILTLLEDAYIFYACDRFDLRGKARLKTTPKYYVVDTGLRNQLLGELSGNLGGQLETIVFLELHRLGFEVYTGRLGEKEIDFVVVKKGIISYIQVAYQLPKNTHETDNLLAIRDNYQKLVITQNYDDVGIIEGIPIIHVSDFLLNSEIYL
ncbi:MAG: ATP-binding protein [Lactobacillales bacterium]|jgi:predicted AAA+ superfamily ATPase|nr:ATP-binding protein [Lactobacillales bacterium]